MGKIDLRAEKRAKNEEYAERYRKSSRVQLKKDQRERRKELENVREFEFWKWEKEHAKRT